MTVATEVPAPGKRAARARSRQAYDPGPHLEGGAWLVLHRNENLTAPAALCEELIRTAQASLSLASYPDSTCLPLRRALAERHGVRPEMLFVGNGSDEVLCDLFHLLRDEHDTVATLDVGYRVYPLLAERFGYRLTTLPGETFTTGSALPPPEGPALIAVDSPNAITGARLDAAVRSRLGAHPDSFLIWDNAYGEFAGDAIPQSSTSDSATVRSFSKFYGLASARVGYCVADESLVSELMRRKDVFNVSAFSQALALAALSRHDAFVEVAEEMVAVREEVRRALEQMGFRVLLPAGNFMLVRAPDVRAERLVAALLNHQVTVRRFPLPQVDDWIRITVPPRAQVDRLLTALAVSLEELTP